MREKKLNYFSIPLFFFSSLFLKIENLLHLNSSLLATMQHLPFYWNKFSSVLPSPGVSPCLQCLQTCLALSEGHSGDLPSFLLEMGDQIQQHPTPPTPNKRGMREKRKAQEWDSTACTRSAQEHLPESRNFFQVINMSKSIFISFFVLEIPSPAPFRSWLLPRGTFSISYPVSLTWEGEEERAPSVGIKIKRHAPDKKKPSVCCKLDWDTKLFTQAIGQLPNLNLPLFCQPWRSSAW